MAQRAVSITEYNLQVTVTLQHCILQLLLLHYIQLLLLLIIIIIMPWHTVY